MKRKRARLCDGGAWCKAEWSYTETTLSETSILLVHRLECLKALQTVPCPNSSAQVRNNKKANDKEKHSHQN